MNVDDANGKGRVSPALLRSYMLSSPGIGRPMLL
jgi:hypothetical protein